MWEEVKGGRADTKKKVTTGDVRSFKSPGELEAPESRGSFSSLGPRTVAGDRGGDFCIFVYILHAAGKCTFEAIS